MNAVPIVLGTILVMVIAYRYYSAFIATLDVMKRAIIYFGHVVSEEDGMKYLAEDLQNVFPELPVKFIPAGNPFN